MADRRICRDGNDTAALYVDGKLKDIGHSDDVFERTLESLGVTFEFDPSFMRGQNTYSGAAQTLDEIDAWVRDREEARKKLEELNAQATAMKKKFNL